MGDMLDRYYLHRVVWSGFSGVSNQFHTGLGSRTHVLYLANARCAELNDEEDRERALQVTAEESAA